MKHATYLVVFLRLLFFNTISSIGEIYNLRSELQHNDHITHRRTQQDPYWVSLGECKNGSVIGVELGQSISLSDKGDLMVTESHVGVFLNRYDTQLGWTQSYDFTELLVDLGNNGGYKVVISGDGSRIAIGVPYNGEQGFRSGAVQVFEKIEDIQSWNQVGPTLYGNGESATYGYSLDLSENGDKLIVGAHNGKYVEIFRYAEETNSWDRKKLYQGNLDGYGYSVAMSGAGDRVVVGAPFENNSVGAVRFYDIETDSFVETINGLSEGDEYGKAVDISQDGTIAAIGAPGNDQVLLFTHDIESNEWKQVGSTINGTSREGLGTSLSLSEDGSTVVVGAPFFGSSAGNAYVYEYYDDWVQIGDGIFGKNSGDSCGASVALSSNNTSTRIVVGCPGEDSEGPDVGQICAYHLFFPSSFPSLQPTIFPGSNYTHFPSISLVPSLNPSMTPSLYPTQAPSISYSPTGSSSPTSFTSRYPTFWSLVPSQVPGMPTVSASPSYSPSSSFLPTISIEPTESTQVPSGDIREAGESPSLSGFLIVIFVNLQPFFDLTVILYLLFLSLLTFGI